VSGWRKDRQDNALKRNLPSIMANRLISFVSGVRLHDFGCSLKAYRREVIEGVRLYGEMHRFLPIYTRWHGAKIAEVGVHHYARTSGTSKYGLERVLKVLADLDPAVAAVAGYTRYRIDGDPAGDAQISIVDRGGLSVGVPSRVERNPQLVGTKRRVAAERQVLVARGRSDNRTVIMVPEVKAGMCVGITLLHVQFHDRLPAAVMRGVLQGYDRRYDRLVDWVTETEGVFRDDLLGEFPVADLLIAPISDAADQWRS